MPRDIYSLITLGLASFLITGLFLGASSYLGVLYVDLLNLWQVEIIREISSILMMVSISSFFVSPVLAALTGLYIGYDMESRPLSVISSFFVGFTGFFILNIVSIFIVLQYPSQLSTTAFDSPYIILRSFLSLENSVALFSFPTAVTAMFSGYIGFNLRTESDSS